MACPKQQYTILSGSTCSNRTHAIHWLLKGYFASEEELEAVLQGKRSNLEITNYFRTAETVYDQALQYYRDKDFRLDLSLVRHIHSELFRGKDDQRGQFRRGSIQILHADVKPPEFDIESYLRTALEVMKEDLNVMPMLSALARADTLFESIHPSLTAMAELDVFFSITWLSVRAILPSSSKVLALPSVSSIMRLYKQQTRDSTRASRRRLLAALKQRLHKGDMRLLTSLLCDGILPRLNQLTILALEQREPLLRAT